MKYCSIIITHYAHVDDFGEGRAQNVSHTRSEMLKFCMESLERYTDYPAEILVFDNGGNPDDSNYLLDLTRRGVINHYTRYKNNMHWAWGFNEGAKIATGDYLCFTCNDMVFRPKWLSTTIGLLEKYPDRKFIATPFEASLKLGRKYRTGYLDGNRLNLRSGSNCSVMTRKAFEEIGEFTLHATGGYPWYKKMISLEYEVIAPPEDYAVHTGYEGGLDHKKVAVIKKELLKGETIDFTEYNFRH